MWNKFANTGTVNQVAVLDKHTYLAENNKAFRIDSGVHNHSHSFMVPKYVLALLSGPDAIAELRALVGRIEKAPRYECRLTTASRVRKTASFEHSTLCSAVRSANELPQDIYGRFLCRPAI